MSSGTESASFDDDLYSAENDSANPLLPQDIGSEYGEVLERLKRSTLRWKGPILMHMAISAIYIIALTVMYMRCRPEKHHNSYIYSPARRAVEWQLLPSNNYVGAKTPYSGYPTPESDKAWTELLKNSNLRISADTLRKLNRSSVQLQDGSGEYMGGLNVHHHLHCIKSARMIIWREHYSISESGPMWSHLDHCLEDLRLAIMCNPDVTILTYDWMPNYKKPWPNFNINGECVNWDKLEAWAEERAFSLFDQKSVVHPELGLSFPVINGVPDGGNVHADPKDIETIKLGTNPKGNWGP